MPDAAVHFLRHALGWGVEPTRYTWIQVTLRGVVVYVAGLAVIRVSNDRFIGKRAAFDIILGFILGSLLSRAINGSGPLFGSLTAVAALLLVHWVFSALGFRFDRFGNLIKGRPLVLVRNGQLERRELRESHIGTEDLSEALRLHGKVLAPADVTEARIERSGDISVVPRPREPRVFEVTVRDGVQTVRIEVV